MNKRIELPADVKFIMDTLWDNGYDSYIVGGCVRDSILNRNPNDWDITTEAEPEEIIKIFDKVILTGVKHGTVTVIINKNQYEITTYRYDGEYEDGRHPQQVKFVKDLKEDLARRDFTINAIAYNERNGIVDYFEGIQDLNKKIIRTVGEPEKRFSEDALRMIRAVRFSSQLNFNIESRTFNSIKKLAANITKVSKERIRDEFNKIIVTDLKRLEELINTDLFEYIIPDMKKIYNYDLNLYKHTVLSMKMIEDDIHLRLVMLLHDFGIIDNRVGNIKEYSCGYDCSELSAEIAKGILKDLRYDNETIRKTVTLITYYNYDFKGIKSIKKLLNKIGYELTNDLIKVQWADALSKNSIDAKKKIRDIVSIENELKKIIDENQCFSLKSLKISGKDLIDLGFKKGIDIGKTLDYLLAEVIEDNISNDKCELVEKARHILNKNMQ